MRFTIRWMAALIVPMLLLTGPEVSAQKGKNKDLDADKDKEVASTDKKIKAGVLVGKVAAIYEDKRVIRLQVVAPKLNPGAIQGIQQAQIQLAQARMTRNWQGMVQAQQSLVRAQATLFTQGWEDIELKVLDDVVVRTAQPRADFDEKGKIKKMTKAELKELKGPDPKVPGFKAEFGDVATEQVVQVTLVRKKPTGPVLKTAPKAAKGKGKVAKDDDAEAAKDLLADNLPQVSSIMILVDPPPSK